MEIHAFFAHVSWILLVGILCIRPLFDIFQNERIQRLLRYRKHFGIACGLAVIAHIGLYLVDHDLLSIYFFNSAFWQFNNLFGWGNLAFTALLIPFLTSNRMSQRFFTKHWKTLQKFSYPAVIFTGVHISFARQEIFYGTVPILVWGTLWLLAYYKNNKKKNILTSCVF